jgi:hypothetical protein
MVMQNRVVHYYEKPKPVESDAEYWRERLSDEIMLSRTLNRISFMVGMMVGGGLVVVGFLLCW